MRVVDLRGRAPDRAVLREAAELLRAGRLVAFPTETVYGLGAHALDPEAVARIYEAKGRPALNPLIVHVASAPAARELAANWPAHAQTLADAFWPGPLTLVTKKVHAVPDIVTAGRDTVGLRVPGHAVALALLEEARIPVAAPSANVSSQVSPTTAQHVIRALGERVDLVVDGGETTVGIESTVVDVTHNVPRILRPGMISREAIVKICGAADIAWFDVEEEAPRSPGLLGRHYAPRARVRLFGGRNDDRDSAVREARAAIEQRHRVGAIVFTPLALKLSASRTMPADPDAYARELYAALHSFDDSSCELVLIERPPDSPEWAAITDRLERAARP
jgi:L-threonylcarbamoyladenylate synthase